MSDTSALPAELFDLAFAALPDWLEPHNRQMLARDMLEALRPHLDARLRPGGNFPPEETEPEDDATRLARINPEKLIIPAIRSPKDLVELLAQQFAPLVERNREIVVWARGWMDAHEGGKKPVADEAENVALADRIMTMDEHAKEVDETRSKVADPLYRAWKAVNGWFGILTTDVETLRGAGKNPPPNTLQAMQTSFLVDKARKERERLEAIQREADERARVERETAEKLRREEEARVRRLEQAGLATEDAVQEVYRQTDEAVAAAEAAATQADQVAAAIAQPTQRLATSRGALSTASLTGTWEFTLESIRELCQAVIDGKAPETFVTVEAAAINQAIRRKVAPLRDVPGLRIYENFSARRRGS